MPSNTTRLSIILSNHDKSGEMEEKTIRMSQGNVSTDQLATLRGTSKLEIMESLVCAWEKGIIETASDLIQWL
jgi:hypothetical protein